MRMKKILVFCMTILALVGVLTLGTFIVRRVKTNSIKNLFIEQGVPKLTPVVLLQDGKVFWNLKLTT